MMVVISPPVVVTTDSNLLSTDGNHYCRQSTLYWCYYFTLTLGRRSIFCQTPVGARLIFSMLLLGAELIFVNLPPVAELFFEPGKRRDPSRSLMPVTK